MVLTLDKKRQDRGQSQEDFMKSMTFASNAADCDCDECGLCQVPAPILEAVQAHKKKKLIESRIRHDSLYQQRELVFRDGGVSIWKLIMPPGAEPLREFGNSHRFVLIDRLSKDRLVKSIGSGIIGSLDEEKGRTKTNWNQDEAFFLKSNDGRAIGWVNKKNDPDERSDNKTNVIIYSIKATQKEINEPSPSMSASKITVVNLLRKYLDNKLRMVDSKDTATLRTIIDESSED